MIRPSAGAQRLAGRARGSAVQREHPALLAPTHVGRAPAVRVPVVDPAPPHGTCTGQRLRRAHRRRRLRDPGRRRSRAAGPWSNVIANPHGGLRRDGARRRLHVGGEQLLLSAHAWHNDPVSDPVSEVLYLRTRRPASCGAPRRRRSARMRRTPCGTARARRRSSTSTAASRTRAHARHRRGRSGEARAARG